MSAGDKVDAFVPPLHGKIIREYLSHKHVCALRSFPSKIVSVCTKTAVNSPQIFNMGELNPAVFNPLAVVCLGGLDAA